MTIIRRIGAVAIAAPLAMSFSILAAPPAQAAATGVITPADGAVVTSGSEVTAKANFNFALTMQLWADGPGIGETFLQERSIAGELTGTFPIRQNGSYKIFLKGKQTGHVYDTSTITVSVAPAAPTGVSAKASGDKLAVTWNRGLEDDLAGYTLSGSGVGGKSGSVDTLCQGTSCSTTLALTRSSGAVSVSVRAQRPNGSGGTMASGAATANAAVSGAGGGSSTSSVPRGSAPALPTSADAPSAGTPLTPFNDESPVTLPSVQPEGATPGLTYPAPQIAADAPEAQNIAATEQLQWTKSVGIALVLLIVAAHLGTWTRHLRVAQGGATNGMAARIARGGTGRKRVRKSREQIARAEALAKAAPVMALHGPAKKDAKPGNGPGADRAGDTMVMPPAQGEPRAARRRPATLGKRPGGVKAGVAKPAGRKPNRGSRRK